MITSLQGRLAPAIHHWKSAFSLAILMSFMETANASTEAAKKFDQLLLNREKALQEAIEPLDKRFAEELESLLKEATESKDFDVVVRLKHLIESLKEEKEDRDLKPTVIGTWGFSNKADGHTAVVELNADQTYTVGGKQIGRWQIRGKRIMITYAEGGHQDRYSLPVQEEKLTGTNRLGHQLTLTRIEGVPTAHRERRLQESEIERASPHRKTYPPAALAYGEPANSAPADGLVAYWNFDKSDGSDASGHNHHGKLLGETKFEKGIHGQALRLRGRDGQCVLVEPTPKLNLNETATYAAWINYERVTPNWGSPILFRGDVQQGRDPASLQILPDGTLRFRSDRSVTDKPVFPAFENEIQLSPGGIPIITQHVTVNSSGTLARANWYFVAATIEKASARDHGLSLYVNGERIAQLTTEETVNYDTNGMGMNIGAVDGGTWQNFAGLIDEVRVYNRALSVTEIRALYRQPPH